MNQSNLTRKDIVNLIYQYKNTKPSYILPFIPHTQINLSGFDLINIDFRGIRNQDLDIFDFTDTNISGAILDRENLDFFLPYIRRKQLQYNNLNITNANLGPKLCINEAHGLKYNKIMNLSDLDLQNTNFSNSSLTGTLFINSNIYNCNFANCTDIFPEQFVSSVNYRNAIFSVNYDEDALFKKHIQRIRDNLVGVNA